jgi:hypothetical protein
MKKSVLIGVVLLCLAACDKSSTDQTETATASEEKFDLKGMYPGMSKSGIEKIIGKMSCTASNEMLQNIENNIIAAEKLLAQNLAPDPVTNSDVKNDRQEAEYLVQYKRSGSLELAHALYKEVVDTVCVIPQDGGQTYANLPAIIEIGLKNGKVRNINIDVVGATTANLLEAMIQKYKWMDGTQNGLEQTAVRFQLGMNLSQGIVDGRDNVLVMSQSPDYPSAIRVGMADSKVQKTMAEAAIKIQERKTGKKDT